MSDPTDVGHRWARRVQLGCWATAWVAMAALVVGAIWTVIS